MSFAFRPLYTTSQRCWRGPINPLNSGQAGTHVLLDVAAVQLHLVGAARRIRPFQPGARAQIPYRSSARKKIAHSTQISSDQCGSAGAETTFFQAPQNLCL